MRKSTNTQNKEKHKRKNLNIEHLLQSTFSSKRVEWKSYKKNVYECDGNQRPLDYVKMCCDSKGKKIKFKKSTQPHFVSRKALDNPISTYTPIVYCRMKMKFHPISAVAKWNILLLLNLTKRFWILAFVSPCLVFFFFIFVWICSILQPSTSICRIYGAKKAAASIENQVNKHVYKCYINYMTCWARYMLLPFTCAPILLMDRFFSSNFVSRFV